MELLILSIAVLADLIVGLFVFSHNRRSATNQLFFSFTVISAIWNIVNYYSLRQATPEQTLNLARWVIFLGTAHALSLFLTIHTFPSKTIRLKKSLLFGILIVTIITLVLTRTDLIFKDIVLTTEGSNIVPGKIIPLFGLVVGSLVASSLMTLFYRFRKAKGVDRSQLQYLLIGVIGSSFLAFITNFIFVYLFKITQFLSLAPLYTIIFILTTGYAILAHHLFDIRVIIKRTLVYSGLLLFTLGIYSMTIFLLTTLFGGSNPFESNAFLSNLLAAILTAVGFEPLRKWLQQSTEKFLFKKEYQEQEVLKELAKKLNDVVALDEALEIVMQTIVKVLHLKHAVTYVFQPGENATTAVKRIKQIGYTSTSQLILSDKDFVIPFFTTNQGMTSVESIKHNLLTEQAEIEKASKKTEGGNRTEMGALIRQHAIKQAVVKKLTSINISLAIPLSLNNQPIGLILLSEKLSGDIFSREDSALLETIGAQAISSIQKAKLYEGDQMKTEFVSIASHELLTPISAIEGYLSMILDENLGHIDPQARDYLNKVYTSAKRLSLLIKDLLSVSRIESGRMKVEAQSLDIIKMIHDTIDQLKFVAAEKKLDLIYDKPNGEIPNVWADPDRTMQILVNLVSNAIKYTPKGSVTISVSANRTSHLVTVSIKDTGLGISKQAQAHLFEKFYRVDTPETTGIMGTGLGLYITKSIIEKMGGTISLKSAVGDGSTFSFTLPVFKVELSKVQ